MEEKEFDWKLNLKYILYNTFVTKEFTLQYSKYLVLYVALSSPELVALDIYQKLWAGTIGIEEFWWHIVSRDVLNILPSPVPCGECPSCLAEMARTGVN